MHSSKLSNEEKETLPWALVLIFVIFTIGIIFAGFRYYEAQRKRVLLESQNNLSAIASLKLNQITQWHNERLGDANSMENNEPLLNCIREYFRNENIPKAKQELIKWMKSLNKYYDYNGVSLIDTSFKSRISVSTSDSIQTDNINHELGESIRKQAIIFTDLYLDSLTNKTYSYLILPLSEIDIKNPGSIGAIVLRIDPAKILFPLIQSWPTPSKSSETLIVRKDGNSVLYLNELRHRRNTSLKLRMPLSNEELLASKVIRGSKGVIEGLDYRNIPVIGYMTDIEEFPWYMVAKVDKDEILLPVQRYLFMIILVVVLLILMNASVFIFFIWQQRIKAYRQKLTDERAIRELEERFTIAFRMSPVSITISSLIDNKFIDINDSFLREMGYTREEVLGRTANELNIWADEKEREWIINAVGNNEKIFGKVIRFKSKSGRVIFGLASMSVVQFQGQPCNLSTVVNVTRRVEAEETIKKQYYALKGITESSRGPIFSLDTNYCYTSFNKVHAQTMKVLYGADIELGRCMLDYQTIPDDRLRAKANLDKSLEGEYIIESAWSGNKGESRRFYEVTHNPICNDENHVVGIAVNAADLTERKLMEIQLSESEDKFKYVFDHSVIGKSITLPTGQINVNKAFCDMTGYSAGELASLKWQDFTHPDDIKLTQNMIDSLLSGKVNSIRFNKRYIKKDGSILWVDLSSTLRQDKNGTPLYFMTSINDITEKIKAFEILRNDEKRFRDLIEALPQLFWTCRADGPCDYLSKQWIDYTGIPESEQLGYGWFEQIHPEDMRKTIDEWNEKIETGENFDMQFRIRRKDGEFHWFQTRAVSMRNNEDKIIKWLGSTTDIENIRKAESQLINYNKDLENSVIKRTEQLEAANKELEAFTYSVSHDLRAPLRAVHGFTKILKEDYDQFLDDEGRRICSIISSSATQMSELIDDLLSFSRIGRSSINPSKLNMEAIAGSIVQELSDQKKNKDIRFTIGNLNEAVADQKLIKHVWNNLISNAIKYSSKEPFPEIIITSREEGDSFIYEVKDNGVGFDMQYSDKLFGVFQRLHSENEFEGNGVGLAIAQRIINRHGGKIWATGETGKGATFCFSLPAVAQYDQIKVNSEQ